MDDLNSEGQIRELLGVCPWMIKSQAERAHAEESGGSGEDSVGVEARCALLDGCQSSAELFHGSLRRLGAASYGGEFPKIENSSRRATWFTLAEVVAHLLLKKVGGGQWAVGKREIAPRRGRAKIGRTRGWPKEDVDS